MLLDEPGAVVLVFGGLLEIGEHLLRLGLGLEDGLLVASEKLAIGLLELDLFRSVVAGHRNENWLLEAEGTLSNEAARLTWLLDQRRLLPDLVDAPLADGQRPHHGAEDHVAAFLLLLVGQRRILAFPVLVAVRTVRKRTGVA